MGDLQSQSKCQADLWARDDQRLLFNFLRFSSTYWDICNNSQKIRLHKSMPSDQRAAVQCHRRYGDVFKTTFDDWSMANRHKLARDAQPVIELHHGSKAEIIQPDDHFIHVPKGSKLQLPDLKRLIDSIPGAQLFVSAAKSVKVRVASLWKIINLVYTRALNPGIEQWRVGALVKLVKAFEHLLDPWAARSVRGQEDMRRHMNLMVKRCLDRAALIAENAAHDLFPNDHGVLHPQFKLNFGDSGFASRLFALGECEAIHARNQVLCT